MVSKHMTTDTRRTPANILSIKKSHCSHQDNVTYIYTSMVLKFQNFVCKTQASQPKVIGWGYMIMYQKGHEQSHFAWEITQKFGIHRYKMTQNDPFPPPNTVMLSCCQWHSFDHQHLHQSWAKYSVNIAMASLPSVVLPPPLRGISDKNCDKLEAQIHVTHCNHLSQNLSQSSFLHDKWLTGESLLKLILQ